MLAMRLFQLGLAGIIGLAYANVGQAGELQPIEANVATLGAVTVITYYPPGPEGFDLVATAQTGEDGAAVPLRFTATLAPGQRVVISVPQAAGEPPTAVEFARIGDRLEVRQTPKKVVLN
jgi:hypothetical protein